MTEHLDDYAKDNRAIEERRKRQRMRELSDLRSVLSKAEGRRLVWRLMAEAGVFRSAFHLSANQTYFNLGVQNLGYLLLNDINVVAPERYAQMQREHASDLEAEKAQSEKSQSVEDSSK